MKIWHQSIITPTTSIKEASQVIDKTGIKTVFITDADNKLLGLLSGGDIRRAILSGSESSHPVSSIMNTKPLVSKNFEMPVSVIRKMKSRGIWYLPIIDDEGHLLKVELLENLLIPEEKENWVVLMAGGKGTRLRPLTENCPKPLLKVGHKPMLETIMENFVSYGFYKFFLSVNYKADMIMEYFGDGSRWGIDIQYLREEESLGTAGSLSLLPEAPQKPIFVMNGDILTRLNFQELLKYHQSSDAKATMCVREYKYQVPYGVVNTSGNKLLDIMEKPVQSFFVSAGIYVLDPSIVNLIPTNSYMDMPTLFQSALHHKHDTSVFPIDEYWIDVGRISDFERANGEYFEVFSSRKSIS